MYDHTGVIRKRLDALDKVIDELNRDNRAMRDAGRLLADFVRALNGGTTVDARAELKVKAALRLFGR